MAYAVFVHLIVLEAGPDYQRSVSSHIALGERQRSPSPHI